MIARDWRTLGGLLVTILVVAAGYVAWRGPTLIDDSRFVADITCGFADGRCVFEFNDGSRGEFRLSPADVPLMRPLRFELDAAGIERAAVTFVGVNMEMGVNRFELHRQPTPAGRFEGDGMLPICTRARMTWEARIELQRRGRTEWVAFRFDTHN